MKKITNTNNSKGNNHQATGSSFPFQGADLMNMLRQMYTLNSGKGSTTEENLNDSGEETSKSDISSNDKDKSEDPPVYTPPKPPELSKNAIRYINIINNHDRIVNRIRKNISEQ